MSEGRRSFNLFVGGTMAAFAALYVLKPPGLFGLPDGDRVVVPALPAGREVVSPTIDTKTGRLVGHGSLSEYRKAEDALSAEFGASPRFKFHDNFMTIVVEADGPVPAHQEAQRLAALLAQGLSVQYGLRVAAEFQSLEDEQGTVQRVPRPLQVSFGGTWYNLTEMRDRLATAVEWSLTADDRSRKALLYFEHSCLLVEFAPTLSFASPHAAFSYALAFLQMYKGLVLLVGEPGVDSDHQRRAGAMGLGPNFWSSRVKPLYRIRNDDDVAHHSLGQVDLGAFLARFRDAAAVFKEAFAAYCRSTGGRAA